MTNEQEFFAVSASAFLYGKNHHKWPGTRSNLKQEHPDYPLSRLALWVRSGPLAERGSSCIGRVTRCQRRKGRGLCYALPPGW